LFALSSILAKEGGGGVSSKRQERYCQKFYEKPIWTTRKYKENPPP